MSGDYQLRSVVERVDCENASQRSAALAVFSVHSVLCCAKVPLQWMNASKKDPPRARDVVVSKI